MLIIAKNLSELDSEQLMRVYAEGNEENGRELYPDESASRQIMLAESDFLSYLREDFFRQKGAFYAVLSVGGVYVSALRLELCQDGWLLEALETRPGYRRRGYAAELIRQTMAQLEPGQRVYSHVSKRNQASLSTHFSCGFQIEKDYAVDLDGTVTTRQVTLLKTV